MVKSSSKVITDVQASVSAHRVRVRDVVVVELREPLAVPAVMLAAGMKDAQRRAAVEAVESARRGCTR